MSNLIQLYQEMIEVACDTLKWTDGFFCDYNPESKCDDCRLCIRKYLMEKARERLNERYGMS